MKMKHAWVPLALAAVACGDPPPPATPTPPPAASSAPPPVVTASASVSAPEGPPPFDPSKFRGALDAVIDATFAYEPQRATASGYHAYDDQWPKLGAAEEASQIQDLRARAEALRIIAKSAPDKADPKEAGTDRPAVDARILADWVDAMAETLESVRPLETNASAVLMIVGYGIERLLAHPFAPLHQRMNSAASRLAQIPELLKVARGRLKSPSKASLENVQIVAAGLAKLLVSDALKPDAKALDGDAPLAQRVKESAAAASKAIEAYAADVKAAYPIDKAENKPLGAAGWGKVARLREGVTESPADVRAMGEAEIKRLNGELDALVKQSGKPGDTRASFLKRYETDTPKVGQVLADYRAANKVAEDWLRKSDFVTVPWDRAKLEIVPSPPHLRGVSFASLNAAGPLDDVEDARFEVNEPDAATPAAQKQALLAFHSHGGMENVSMHEALPGHYLQALIARKAPSRVRRVVWVSSYGEGWAHYVEEAAVAAGFAGKDPVRAKAIMLRFALQRAVRVVVDVGENDGSLTVEAGEKRLMEDAFLPKEAARIEARRAIVWPVNMFTYTYGKLHIMKLRDKVKAKQGAAFSQKSFHDRLLATGSVPLPYAAEIAFGPELSLK
jgi:uncharacterized protein (DUF885 family)